MVKYRYFEAKRKWCKDKISEQKEEIKSYDRGPQISRNVKTAKWQHKNNTTKFDYNCRRTKDGQFEFSYITGVVLGIVDKTYHICRARRLSK